MSTAEEQFHVGAPEPERPQVVEQPAPRVVEVPRGTAEVVPANQAPSARADAALDAAASAALAMPGVPGREEFLGLAMQARILSMSGAAPKLVRQSPHIAFHVAMVGRDLGISPSAAVELIDVIDTQGGPRLSLSPQLLNGQIRRLGLGSIVPVVQTMRRCVAVALAPGGAVDVRCRTEAWPAHAEGCGCHGVLGSTEFDWEEARVAGLVGPECEPGQHKPACLSNTQGKRCNQGYRNYPKRMLWWRASGFCADDYFPEAGLGLYTAEELGSIVDEDGRPLDPGTVELPAGYEPAERQQRTSTQDQPAEWSDLFELWLTAQTLPADQRAELREAWKRHERLEGWSMTRLPRRMLATVRGMVNAHAATARRAGWDEDGAKAAFAVALCAGINALASIPPGDAGAESPQEPPDGSDGPEAASGAEPTENGQEAPDPAPPKPKPDGAERAEVARLVTDMVKGADADLVDRVATTVKSSHHGVVDRQLRDLGWDPEGRHIDSRRMMLTALLVSAELRPETCVMFECGRGVEPDERHCSEHVPL